MDCKLQNNREKRSISRKKQLCRILLVGNLEKLAKNRQVGIICHVNVKRKQEAGNRQTNRQTKYCNPRAHTPSVNYTIGIASLSSSITAVMYLSLLLYCMSIH